MVMQHSPIARTVTLITLEITEAPDSLVIQICRNFMASMAEKTCSTAHILPTYVCRLTVQNLVNVMKLTLPGTLSSTYKSW